MDKKEDRRHEQQAGWQVHDRDIFHLLDPLEEPDGQQKLIERQQEREEINPIMIPEKRDDAYNR